MDKPMKLTMTTEAPTGVDWNYEVKYDGFRALLHWTSSRIQLMSRNGKDLSKQFPEITKLHETIKPSTLPFTLDGELVILNTPYQANFEAIQQRGRLRSDDKITDKAEERPATFMAFDLLKNPEAPYTKRRKALTHAVQELKTDRIQLVESFAQLEQIDELVIRHRGEGMVAKQTNSTYQYGRRSKQWQKVKNWRTVTVFLTRYDPSNDYYSCGLYDGDEIVPTGKFKHGLDDDQSETLKAFFKQKGEEIDRVWHLPPSVCVDVHCLGIHDGEFREPLFKDFRFDLKPAACTKEQLEWDLAMVPPDVPVSNEDKRLWPNQTKRDYLIYLREIAPYMLPFLEDKKLTVIRYPDGIEAESFFQKHLPDHAPDYIGAWVEAGKTYMTCTTVEALLWFGNQAAIEWHIPFQKAGGTDPDEIVFDLDPPDRDAFSTAVLAARLLHHLLNEMGVHSFVKTSGSKGIQVHIPIEEGSMSYDETRRFTESLASLIIKEKPDLFTMERLKKNRGKRLYLDYVQHAKGKTIVAPYSPRAKQEASTAVPLYWHELTEELRPEHFPFTDVVERVQKLGCPFAHYNDVRGLQPIETMKSL
ncbi:DNA ligase D [Halobacillus litoralis]|uniref:DNA ligase D n=1 Tax=Halobacillus litoralis TaxID=45668 RepID=UPI001CD1A118|nr:DNA ligase D [Halobacillus litoralis]MCA0971267.1 DNA ligase D [Halobacillus litoralis]